MRMISVHQRLYVRGDLLVAPRMLVARLGVRVEAPEQQAATLPKVQAVAPCNREVEVETCAPVAEDRPCEAAAGTFDSELVA